MQEGLEGERERGHDVIILHISISCYKAQGAWSCQECQPRAGDVAQWVEHCLVCLKPWVHIQYHISRMRRHRPVFSALGKKRQGDHAQLYSTAAHSLSSTTMLCFYTAISRCTSVSLQQPFTASVFPSVSRERNTDVQCLLSLVYTQQCYLHSQLETMFI